MEQVDHLGSQVERVCNTVELSDYFGRMPGRKAMYEPCYNLETTLNLTAPEMAEASENGVNCWISFSLRIQAL